MVEPKAPPNEGGNRLFYLMTAPHLRLYHRVGLTRITATFLYPGETDILMNVQRCQQRHRILDLRAALLFVLGFGL